MPTLPTDITFRDLIAQNKRNSAILIGVMAVITLTLAMLIGAAVMAYGFGVIRPQGLIIAAVSAGCS
jgi:hypothetical protein